MSHVTSTNLATVGKRFSSAVRRLSQVAAIGGYFACSALAVAAPLNISDTPLFLTGGVKPNLLMAIDDSGSMDFETLVPGNDGAAWWRAKGQASGACANNVNDGSFAGCVSNNTDSTSASDVPLSGKLNFNASGGNGAIWKEYIYLFPNGSGTTRQDRRRNTDGNNAYFAIPPLGAFGWSRSVEYNAAYFDPAGDYSPWQNGGGYTFTDAPPTATRFDPIYGGFGTINLKQDFAGNGNVDPANDCTNASMPGIADNYYFRVYPGMTIPEGTCMRRRSTDGANWPTNDWVMVGAGGCVVSATSTTNDCPVYVNGAGAETIRTLRNKETATANPSLVAIRYFPATFFASAANPPPATFGFDDAKKIADGLAPDGVTVLYRYEIKPDNFDTPAQYDAAIQSFANWFGYYRKRHMALRAGLGKAFNGVNNMRVAGFTINQTSSPTNPDIDMTASDIDVAANRTALYNKFYYDWTGTGGTPNRQAVANLVRNYQRSDSGAPVTASCQRNFGMLFTDGYSNPPAGGDGITGLANLDNGKGNPYEDGYGDRMADLTMSAYENNLRPDFTAGLVQPPSACSDVAHDPWLDCNKNLHMNFYAVTLGTRGVAYDPDAPTYSEYITTPTWPAAILNRHPSAVDDLWHATINGRGRLLNAKRPSDLATQLSEVLRNVADASGSAASASVSSGTVSSTLNNRAFTVSFDTKHWSGSLRASQIFPNGTYGTPITAEIPVDENKREIITTDSSGKAIPFRWASISADDPRKDALHATDDAIAQARLEYLRGSRVGELNGTFRVRSGSAKAEVLGDIVNSAPVYVGAPPFTYKDSLEPDAYSAFSQKPANKDRPRMIYVGANDGMLHGFKTTDDVAEPLVEAFAYIPGPVFNKLPLLTSPAYTHRFYVDGTVAMTDAYYAKKGVGSKDWRTVLAGGLNKGGQGIYVLDVTNPDQLNESNAEDIVEWEFSDAQDADLGYTYSRPAVVRMHDDKWYVVFGNGYDSTDTAGGTDAIIGSGKPVLYIVDLETGVLKRKITLPDGSAANPNGLSTPAVVDLEGDDVVDFAYAGDLHGNMWKFDLRDKDPLKWDVLKNGGAPVALFVAQDAGGDRQPITTRPQVGRGPRGAGQVVLFGTGRFLKNSDRDINYLDTQTFYGVHDSTLAVTDLPLDRGDLVKQQVLDEQPVAGVPVRITSTNVVGTTDKGWYMDLLKNDTTFEGEMLISDSVLRNGRIAFATLIPDPDPCKSGGRSWFMLLDALSGARLVGSTFDVDGNKTFGTEDMGKFGAADVLVSGVGSTDGIMSQPRFVSAPGGDLGLVTDTLNRQFSFLINSGNRIGRQSWRQLR
jgi:type IV pilus assembly protein PilY1